MKRWLVIGGGVVGFTIVATIAVAVLVLSNVETLMQQAIEVNGSEMTKAAVTVEEVDIDLVSGKGSLTGFKVGNPAGFKTPSALKLGLVSIQLDAASIAEDTVIIKDILIDGAEITYEVGGDGSNFDAIQDNVESYLARFGSGSWSSDAEGPRLIIENLIIRNGTVNVSATMLQGKSLAAPLDEVHLTNIGLEGGGATPPGPFLR